MRGLALMCLAMLSTGASLARASCVAPPQLEILWSYPENGMQTVPTDAVFWALTSTWGAQPVATLNGVALVAQNTGTFSAYRMQPVLEPGREYVWVLDYAGVPGISPGSKTRFEITFKTGSAAISDTVPLPTVSEHALRVGTPEGQLCAEIIGAQDCFDTGQSLLLGFAVSQTDDTLGWSVTSGYQGASTIWPARCGDPTLYVRPSTSRQCFQIQRIGAGGRLSRAVEHCLVADPASASPSTAGQGGAAGANAGGGGAGASASTAGADADRPRGAGAASTSSPAR